MSQIPPMQPPMQQQQGYPMGYGQAPKSQGLAITSMILGIISIPTFCAWYLSIPLGVTAIILAIVAKGKIARGEADGKGMAKAGMITGIIGVVLAVLFAVLIIAGVSMFGDKFQKAIEEAQRQQQQQMEQAQQQQQKQQDSSAPANTTTEDADSTTTDNQQDTTEPATPEGTK